VKCDLHVHTHCSDGVHPPGAVVEFAREGGIDLLSITDHDTIAAYDSIESTDTLRLLPGVEITTHMPDVGELHILGYFPFGFPDSFRDALRQIQAERSERMRCGVARLAQAGLALTMADVEQRCQGDIISRSHLAQTLVDKRLVDSYADAFDRYLGSHQSFVPAPLIRPEGAIDIIRRSRGISIWAHPQLARLERFLAGLVGAGLNGIEVYGRRRTGAALKTLESAAESYRLLRGGGSDWHGHRPSDKLGSFTVPSESIGQLLSFFKGDHRCAPC